MPEPTIMQWQRATDQSRERSRARRRERELHMFPRHWLPAIALFVVCVLVAAAAWIFLTTSWVAS